jgi:Flp pilus assembly protein TadG
VPAARPAHRSGTVLVLVAVGLVFLFGLVAFAADLGYLHSSYAQMQTCSDAGALAGVGELLRDEMLMPDNTQRRRLADARSSARRFAELNRVGMVSPNVDLNPDNGSDGDVVMGYLDPGNVAGPVSYEDPIRFNSCTVRVRRTYSRNGPVLAFFGRVLGRRETPVVATSTAIAAGNVTGFRLTEHGHADILPIAIDEQRWLEIEHGGGEDEYTYNRATDTVTCDSDSLHELTLLPLSGGLAGSLGNFGVVDLDVTVTSTSDLIQQVRHGVRRVDLAGRGGQLLIASTGSITLTGTTDVAASIRDEIASLVGQTRVVPLYRSVRGQGRRAQYTIVSFAGVRIMKTKTGRSREKLTGLQPAIVAEDTAVTGPVNRSYHIYSNPRLVR